MRSTPQGKCRTTAVKTPASRPTCLSQTYTIQSPIASLDPTLADALEDAFTRLRPFLDAHPLQLASRLARGRAITSRVNRAWCLAVRAADLRLNPLHIPMAPSRPIVWDPQTQSRHYFEHQVHLSQPNLAWLCRPPAIPSPGLRLAEVAQMLGVIPNAIRAAVKRGALTRHYCKNLGGLRGQIPIVFTRQLLDPAAIPLGSFADIVWGTMHNHLSENIPPSLAQTLTRLPTFRPLHPPLPHSNLNPNLNPNPNPNPNPIPTPSPSLPQPQFTGWRWLCPGCSRQVTRLYYPLHSLLLADFVRPYLASLPNRHRHSPLILAELDNLLTIANLQSDISNLKSEIPSPISEISNPKSEIPSPQSQIANRKSQIPPTSFACSRCHHIHSPGRLNSQAWNALISQLSAGLLFGHEVPIPPAWLPIRKRPYSPRPHRAPSQRIHQITHLLSTTTLSCSQIALKLSLRPGTVRGYLRTIYKRQNIHSRQQLRTTLNSSPPS